MNPFQHHKRGSMTAARVARIFVAREGRCGIHDGDGWGDGCGWKFSASDDYDVDHILALERGGTDDDDNLQLLCNACHSKKTPDDHITGSKMKRTFAKSVVPKKFRRGRGWR